MKSLAVRTDIMLKTSLFVPRNGGIDQTWCFFSSAWDDRRREECAAWLIREKMDTMVFLLDDNDPNNPVSFWKKGIYCGEPDLARVDMLLRWCRLASENGWNLIPTLFCDEDKNAGMRAQWNKHADYLFQAAAVLNPFVKGWLIGLESSEYFNAHQVDQLVAALRPFTPHPIGTHMQWDLKKESLPTAIDFMAYEHPWHPKDGDAQSAQAVADQGRRVIEAFRKPVWFLEYNYNPSAGRVREQTRALMQLPGCVGIGGPF